VSLDGSLREARKKRGAEEEEAELAMETAAAPVWC
jgi:hypothetical protein